MEFAQPYWLALLVPALWPVVRAWRARPPGLRYASTDAARRAPVTWRVALGRALPVLRTLALALGVLALARPRERDVTHERYAEGIDIMLVLDTSTSMRALDFQPDRFHVAREVAGQFIQGRTSDRIGLVVFAAEAYTQAPLTLDYDFLQQMLAEVETGIIADGTAIGTALATAANRLRESEARSKVVILLTDGQNNRGEVDPVTAAEVAATLGVRVYVVGVGAHGEAPMVFEHPFAGRQVKMVPVEIDEEMLRRVASTTGGQYYRATSAEALRGIYREIGELERTRIADAVYTDYEERYAAFLLPAFALLLVEVLLSTTVLRVFP